MRSLDAICETFAPGAVEQGVPDAVLDAMEHDLSRRERQRLQLLLRTWLPGYSRLSHSRREAVLRGWRDSPVPLMRTGFQALRKAALAFAYMLPGRWEAIGYPGPLGPRADAPGPRLDPHRAARRARARVRRLRRRVGRRRRCRGRGSRCGRTGRGRARGGRLLVGARLRRRRADRPAPPVPRRRRLGDGRPGRRADRGRLSRRRHGRQLLDLVSHSRRGAGGVGRARLPVSGARTEPRRGLRPARRQHRPQPSLAPRRGDAARPRVARLARRRDAARRPRLRTGRRLRLLRLRLSARREAVDAADVARGRGGRGRPHRGRDEGAARARPRRAASRRRRRARCMCAHAPSSSRRARSRPPRCCSAPA